MKRTLTALAALIIAIGMFAQSKSDKINGIWTNEQKNIRIEFFKSTTGYAAKIIWLAQPNDESGNPKLDAHNPDPALRKTPIVGTTIIYNLRFDGKNYVNGKIYAPKRGLIADCSIRIIDNNTIEITGKKGLFNDTKTWTRYK